MGLDREHEILESDEFAAWMERIEDQEQVILAADDDEVLASLRDSGDSTSVDD